MPLSDAKEQIFSGLRRKTRFLHGNLAGILAFLFSFTLVLTFIDITLSRNAAIRTLKNRLAIITKDLNNAGLDIAYDQISFNNIFIYPLVEIKNLQLYNLRDRHLWKLKLNNIEGRPGLFNARKLKINFNNGDFSLDETRHALNINNTDITLELKENGEFKEIEAYLTNTQIKDFAKIENIIFAARSLNNTVSARVLAPTLESHLDIKDVALNGLLNYPLTSKINRIYGKFNLMGNLNNGETLQLAAENWLQQGGFIEIPSLTISWDPLLLVGRGEISFDENFAPKFQIQTTSKAMLELLNDLQEKNFLNRKGVFVANVLLNAKAFKLHEEDKHLTITTPITYRDNKLAIENITVKTLD